MTKPHALVLVTCGSAEEAKQIARRLVTDRLAAGVQILPISSVYTWNDEVFEDGEQLLICKTRSDLYPDIEQAVSGMHSYEVPPILMLKIDAASGPYLEWINQATS